MEITSKDLFSDEKVREFGEDYVKILVKNLRSSGKTSSGKLIKSINSQLQMEAEEINIIILSEDYIKYVDEGRKPGSYPNIKAISKWASVRGITQTAVFPIARSIYKFGIKPTNVIEKSINEITGPQYIRKIEDEVSSNVEEIIVKEINKLN